MDSNIIRDFRARLTLSIASKDRPKVVEARLRELHDCGVEDCSLAVCDEGLTPALDPEVLRLFPLAQLFEIERGSASPPGRNRVAVEWMMASCLLQWVVIDVAS